MLKCLVAIYRGCMDAIERMNESSLGPAVLAGTNFPMDCFMIAKELGSRKSIGNAIDCVFDRNFALKFLSAGVRCAIHLSRLAEEIILWLSEQFCFIRLSDIFSLRSSIMPKKRKPDAAKLVRAKVGR